MAAKQSNLDKQLEDALASLIKFIWSVVINFFRGLGRGLRKLNKWQAWIGLSVCILIALGTRFLWQDKILCLQIPEYVTWLIYGCLLGTPIIYLLILGGFKERSKDDYEQLFRDIGFVGKNGECPKFINSKIDGKKNILIFQSYIPLVDWIGAKERLETALDCTILKMENGRSKRILQMTTLPADYKIPDKVIWQDSYCSDKDGIVVIGHSALDTVSFDVNSTPHVLDAGETGSGKSVLLRCMLRQFVLKGAKVFMIDFKGGVEFGKRYDSFGEVVTDRERALEILNLLERENELRLKLFRELEVKNLSEYNRKTGANLCRIGLFVDEIAQMLDKRGIAKEKRKIYEELEAKLATLARLSRATGINLFLGVQRPDATVLTGQIKNNIPIRICGRFADKSASEIVLGNTDAVMLPDIKGRFLYKMGNETIEFQAFYFDDDTMLHDVDVDVGNMLIDMPVYVSSGNSQTKKNQEQLQEKSRWSNKRKKVLKKENDIEQTEKYKDNETYSDSEIYQDIEEELPFGPATEVDEYDFDFFRERREKRR